MTTTIVLSAVEAQEVCCALRERLGVLRLVITGTAHVKPADAKTAKAAEINATVTRDLLARVENLAHGKAVPL